MHSYPLNRRIWHNGLHRAIPVCLLVGMSVLAGVVIAASADAVLKEPVQFDLVINGKTVGSTKVPAGTKVAILGRDGARVRIAHGSGREAWVEQSQLEGVEQHNPASDYQEARALLLEDDKGGNWDRAFELMRRAAVAGFPAAQREWGVMLADGFGVKQNLKEAEKFLSGAAGAGDTWAIFELGNLTGDRTETMQLINRAAEKGDLTARLLAAGPETDWSPLLEEALQSGDSFAVAFAASQCAQAAKDPEKQAQLGMAAEELQSKAVKGFREAERDGLLEAHIGLADLARTSDGARQVGVGRDALLANFRRLCEQRIQRGSIAAVFMVTNFVMETPASLDRKESLRLLNEAMGRTDHPPAISAICCTAANVLVGSGSDNTDDLREAITWLEKVPSGPSADGVAPLIEKHRAALAELEAKSADGSGS